MRIPAVAATALALTALFGTAASAQDFDGDISVRDRATISYDGTLTLSGGYRCDAPSPARRVFVTSSLVQDGKRVGFGGTEAVCDGQWHEWRGSGQVDRFLRMGFHDGPARVDARLVTLEEEGGLPSPRALAGHEQPVHLDDARS
ncbi:DUF6299 family protein [Streptomyces sp. NPDC097619]|uniref:DUF6299 family protein n=1 Tax=Streptomyces sp. NPDC097619 TaxID=3157228 RepID=UPI00333255E2